MNNGLMVTVVGWAASTPRQVMGDGTPFTSFRLACTPRFYDRQAGAWRDRRTEWFTVKAFRDAAYNVAASVHKGDPVVVHGRLSQREWAGEDGVRTTLELDAAVVGHDLTRGTARFARTVHVGADAGAADEGPGAEESPGVAEASGDVDPWAVEPSGDAPGDGSPDAADDGAAVSAPVDDAAPGDPAEGDATPGQPTAQESLAVAGAGRGGRSVASSRR